MSASSGAGAWRAALHVALAALALVATDAAKPLVVDDAACAAFGRQIHRVVRDFVPPREAGSDERGARAAATFAPREPPNREENP